MKNVVNNLYDRYTENVTNDVVDDEFYQYFYNLLETGTTLCKFYNRKLIKDVDEEWVEQIEKTIPHLVTVVDFPRRFIDEDRNIVNVALARKFTSESVKHLAQNSHMVNKVNDDGSVEPNKVLNITKEESLNTYENRFIYTLLMELRNFVNKRFEALFENSKDEDGIKLNLESLIDNYTEVVSYKMEVKIREKQADTSNDKNNLNIFTRITKIHKAVMEMTSSGFMLEMQKFPAVRHPIVKTNAISKNPDYKACYNLWNFLHSYDRVGYKVQIIDQDPMVTRSFESDLYNSILMNYVIVRRYMTNRELLNINREKRTKEIGLKDIKQFIREVVNEYDIAPKELRKLMMDELTAAIKDKEHLEQMRDKVIDHQFGKKNIILDENGDNWSHFKQAAETQTTGAENQPRGPQLEPGQYVKVGVLEQSPQVIRPNVFGSSIFAIDSSLINGDEISGGMLDENILKDARFTRLIRKIEKSNQKRQIKRDFINKKYEEVLKEDADKAQKILDRAEADEQERIRRNELARQKEIEKARKDEEKLKQKVITKQLKNESKQERKLAKEENKEKVLLLRKQHKEELAIRRQQKLIERELDKEARAQRRIEEKNNRIEAKKRAAIEREAYKVQREQMRHEQMLEKKRLSEEMRRQREENARLRKIERAENARIAAERKSKLQAELKQKRLEEKERQSALRIKRKHEQQQLKEARLNAKIQHREKVKEERELRIIAIKRLKAQKKEEERKRREQKRLEAEKKKKQKQQLREKQREAARLQKQKQAEAKEKRRKEEKEIRQAEQIRKMVKKQAVKAERAEKKSARKQKRSKAK